MEYDFYFQINLTRTKAVDLFEKEGFTINYKHICNVRISKDISRTNPSNYVMLYFMEDRKRNEIDFEGAKIKGEKEEIIDFFKYFFELSKRIDFLDEPLEVVMNNNRTKSIVIENEEDIYEIFDENSTKVRDYI